MKAASLQLLRALRCSAFPHTPIKHCQRAFSLQRVPRPLSQHLNLQPISSFSTAITTQSRTARVSTDRGPISDESTQTDFGALDVLGNATPPTTAIDACLSDGFHLDNGVKITHGSGCLLVAGEAFSWRPWETIQSGRSGMINKKGQWEIAKESWGILDLVWPKPDMLVLGLGANTYPISPETRNYINSLGISVDIQDTRNAAAQFNLLATERGVSSIAAALIPIGWKGR